jgi:hypothetical protein
MSRERLHVLSVEVTQRQMETDEAIAQLQGRRRIVETMTEQRKDRLAVLDQFRDGWTDLDFEHRRALITEVVERVTVLDKGAVVRLRS